MEKLGAVTIILIILVAIIFGPLLTIWALNTLFPALAIPYAFKTWLAAGIFNMAIASRASK